MEETDKENLMLREVGNTRHTQGHSKKLRKGKSLNNIKKYSFPQRNIEVWNKLSDAVVSAKHVHNFRENWTNLDMETGPHENTSGPVNYK